MAEQPRARLLARVVLAQLVRTLAAPLTVSASALLWVTCVTLNNDLFFEWTAVTEFRHLIFVPAGAKLVLVMALGARGAFGIALGTMTFLHSDLPTLSTVQAVACSLAYAGVPLVVLSAFSRVTGLAKPWFGLGTQHLALITVAVAVASSIAFNGLLAAWGILSGVEVLPAAVAMAGGDVTGTGILLAAALGGRALMRRLR